MKARQHRYFILLSIVIMGLKKILTLEEKVNILKTSRHLSYCQIAKKFGIGKTTVFTICANKAEIMERYELQKRKYLKLHVAPDGSEVDKLLSQWIVNRGVLLSEYSIQIKAQAIARQIGDTTFTASTFWVREFIWRHNLFNYMKCSKYAAVCRKVDKLVYDWFVSKQSTKMSISGRMLRTEAIHIA